MTARSIIARAMLGGVAVGALAAAVIPTAGSAPLDTPFAAPRDPLTTAAQRSFDRGPKTDSSVYLRVHPGTLREEVRRADPTGGPDWVVRVFDADRMISPAIRRPGTDGKISVALCAQLGREVRGTFGWIDGENRFRRVTTASMEGLPAFCTTRRLGRKRTPEVRTVMLVDRPRAQDPAVRGSVVWGLTGREARSATIENRGRTQPARLAGAHGAFLSFFGAGTPTPAARLRVTYPGGGTASAPKSGGQPPRVHMPSGVLPETNDPLRPDSMRVIARAADPAGGPSWGLLGVQTKSGRWCLGQFGTLLGNRVGELDPSLGTAREPSPTEQPNGCGPKVGPTAQRPIQLMSASGNVYERPLLSPQADALRLLPGRQFTFGRATDDVRSLTITSPGGVRTVVPSGPANAFIVVEGGEYLFGQTRVTVHMNDGTTRTERI